MKNLEFDKLKGTSVIGIELFFRSQLKYASKLNQEWNFILTVQYVLFQSLDVIS